MPKNKGKGGKNRRRGKNENEFEKRELIFKEDRSARICTSYKNVGKWPSGGNVL